MKSFVRNGKMKIFECALGFIRGATTFSITTLSIKTLGVKTLSIMTLSIMTLSMNAT